MGVRQALIFKNYLKLSPTRRPFVALAPTGRTAWDGSRLPSFGRGSWRRGNRSMVAAMQLKHFAGALAGSLGDVGWSRCDRRSGLAAQIGGNDVGHFAVRSKVHVVGQIGKACA